MDIGVSFSIINSASLNTFVAQILFPKGKFLSVELLS
jgi:hypothetical protein